MPHKKKSKVFVGILTDVTSTTPDNTIVRPRVLENIVTNFGWESIMARVVNSDGTTSVYSPSEILVHKDPKITLFGHHLVLTHKHRKIVLDPVFAGWGNSLTQSRSIRCMNVVLLLLTAINHPDRILQIVEKPGGTAYARSCVHIEAGVLG